MAFLLFSVGYGVSLQSSFKIKSNERRKDSYIGLGDFFFALLGKSLKIL